LKYIKLAELKKHQIYGIIKETSKSEDK